MADTVMRMPEPAASGSALRRAPLVVQRVCAECEEALQRETAPIQRACLECEKEQHVVRTRRTSGDSFESSSALTSYVTYSRRGGQPLCDPVRARFESRFGHDFGPVRIHAGARSHEAASEIHALAFTSGPTSTSGRASSVPGRTRAIISSPMS
jgi:hypothetical protein